MGPGARDARTGGWESPGGSGRLRARAAWLAVALAAVAGVVAAVASSTGRTPAPTPSPLAIEQDDGAPERPLGRLPVVPSAPIAPRAHPHAVWTGREVLVWSGALAVDAGGAPATGADGRFRVADDGAAYDPRTGRWRRLPPAPIRGRVHAAAVWTGEGLVVWGGFAGPDRPLADGAVYRVEEDAWERLPAAPIGARGQALAAWTGRALLVVAGTRVAGEGPPARAAALRDGAAFEPDTGRWEPLPALPETVWPLPGRFAGAWTGEALVAWGRELALYRPGAAEWERVRPPPTGLWSGVPVQAVPLEGGVVAFGLVVRQAPAVYGLAYGTPGVEFAQLPPLERSAMTSRQQGVVAGGDRVIVLLGPPADAALAWRPGRSVWARLPSELASRQGAALVWTGRALLVWGGSDGHSLRADGLSWAPGRSVRRAAEPISDRPRAESRPSATR